MMQGTDGLMLARVMKFHPHDNSCDCQLIYDNSRLTGVPMMTGMVTGSSGRMDWHEPEGNDWDADGSSTRDVIAIIGHVSGNPLVLGFLARQVSEMTFNRPNFRVDRHASDVYHTIDGAGNIELSHPSGTYARIATNPAHEDLSGKDYDSSWSIKRNKTANVWLSVVVANASGVKAKINIDPSGNAYLEAKTFKVKALDAVEFETYNFDIRSPDGHTGRVRHEGVNIGSTHVHGGVKAGTDKSGAPTDPTMSM